MDNEKDQHLAIINSLEEKLRQITKLNYDDHKRIEKNAALKATYEIALLYTKLLEDIRKCLIGQDNVDRAVIDSAFQYHSIKLSQITGIYYDSETDEWKREIDGSVSIFKLY